jgi:transcriptional regulator with XRE-family HTH domain
MTAKRMTARRFLGREIKIARQAKGMSHEQLGKVAFVTEGLVRAWESGRRLPQPDSLDLIEPVLGTNGTLRRMRDDLVKNEPIPEYMDRWRELEETATSFVTYEVLYVPGLFQTPEYAREVFKESGRQFDDVDYQVKERIDRQEVIKPEHGMMIVAIIDEVILERPVGGKEVMHAQMIRLLELAEQSNIEIQVVSLSKGAYSGLSGGFVIATVDGREYAYVDDAFSGDVLENPDEVAAIKRLWATLNGKALPTDQSIERIRQAVEKWKP